MTAPNVFDSQADYDDADPPGYRSGHANVGAAAGGSTLTVNVFELQAGESVCPFHYEYEEEWLVVIAGTPTVRTPSGERQLVVGEVVCFEPGPAGAHKVTNHTEPVARVLMFSSARQPAVSVYPDSDKIGVWPGNSEDEVMLRRKDGRLAYFDGEM